jgi:membrane-bound ClpP family serine protease
MAVYDDIIFQIVREAEADIEERLDANILYFNSEIRMNIFSWFREIVEKIAATGKKKSSLAVVLTTPGGQAEAVEKLVEVAREHFELLYCIVPVAAMSAGTIFCMAADKIYMDYSSSLGPIDPQVPDRDGRFLIPALGHLDKVNETIEIQLRRHILCRLVLAQPDVNLWRRSPSPVQIMHDFVKRHYFFTSRSFTIPGGTSGGRGRSRSGR